MSAKVLTKAAAKEAKIDIIEDGRGSQAVHDVVVAMRAARRSGSANTAKRYRPGAGGLCCIADLAGWWRRLWTEAA